jgi:S-adenosylmethionine-diacylglycerol 3-amino-3-carboxypropyl transferase
MDSRETWLRGIRYASCWEDAAIVAEGLGPLAGARCLSVASGGDNTFSLLARRPESVLAVDVNPAQLALVELKAAAFAALPLADLVVFLGAAGAPRRSDPLGPWRLSTYATALRPRMSERARSLWDARPRLLARGVVHSGRLEGYFQLFRRVVLPLAHRRDHGRASPRRTMPRGAFTRRTRPAGAARAALRALAGPPGRDPPASGVDRPVGPAILARARDALGAQPIHGNPYLRYILTGSFGPLRPDYLRPEHYEPIRDGLSRLTLREGTLESVLPSVAASSFDAFNLSDVGEYLSPAEFDTLLREVRRTASHGARIAWWNLLAPREHPADLDASLDVRAADSGLTPRPGLLLLQLV